MYLALARSIAFIPGPERVSVPIRNGRAALEQIVRKWHLPGPLDRAIERLAYAHQLAAELAREQARAPDAALPGTKAGDTRPTDWTPGAVRAYVDARANHELRYLRRLFSWAYEPSVRGSRAPRSSPPTLHDRRRVCRLPGPQRPPLSLRNSPARI